MDTYLSVQEVADRLGVSVFTIRRYIRSGKLKAVKLEAVYRVSREDIAEFLKSHEFGPRPGFAVTSGPTPPARNDPDGTPSEALSSAATTAH